MKKKLLSLLVVLVMILTQISAVTVFASTSDKLETTTGMVWDSWGSIVANQLKKPPLENPSFDIPPSVDLTSKFPPPLAKGQEGQNSCVALTVAYNLKSGQENIARKWGFDTNDHLFSPSYVYNQLNEGRKDKGISIGGAMGLIVEQGVCSLKSFPYVGTNWTSQPTQEQKNEAAQFKAVKWGTVIGLDEIKRHLAEGDGVVIGIEVLPQFDTLFGQPQFGEIKIFNNPSGTSRGGHALCLIGYDDELQAFKFINTWNKNYGYGGYGWIAYKMLSEPNVNLHNIEHGFVLINHYKIKTTIVTTASAEEVGGKVTGDGLFNPDTDVTLTATPYSNYEFMGWYEGDIKVSSAFNYTFKAKADRTLKAEFMKRGGSTEPVYIMAIAGQGGTVTGGGMHFYGDNITLTATPNAGYKFEGWYEDGIKINGAGATYSFIGEEFRMLEARFN